MTTSELSKRRVYYVQFTNPAAYPPLEHSSQILADLGWQVLFLGTGALGADGLRFPDHPNIENRRLPFPSPGWRQKVVYAIYMVWVIWHVLRRRPEWIYASDLFACPVALLLTYWPGLRVLYHEHDAPTETGSSVFIRWLRWTRSQVARRADLCVVPNQQRAEYFKGELAAPHLPMVVWNCPRKNEGITCRSSLDRETMWVLYNGSLVPSRLPLTVIRALTLLPTAVRLKVVGYETVGAQGYVDQLTHLAAVLGVADRVEYIGAVPTRRDLTKVVEQCHVGLTLFMMDRADLNEETMVGASNKPFGYLACGLPLLVSDLPEWKETFVEAGYGLACDPGNAQSMADVLQWYWDHPKEREDMGSAGRQRILAEWNYETQFETILKIISSRRRQE